MQGHPSFFFLKNVHRAIKTNDLTLMAIAEKIVRMLEKYKGLVCSEARTMTQILEPHCTNDYWIDGVVLRLFVVVSEDVVKAEQNLSENIG